MESVFPQVLFLGPIFAPVLLRIAAAVAYFVMAQTYYKHRVEFAKTKFPIVGAVGKQMTWVLIALTLLVGLSFVTGFYLQIAAIIGFFGAIKQWYFSKAHPHLFAFQGLAYFLLAIICAALFILGAGGFAFDLPY